MKKIYLFIALIALAFAGSVQAQEDVTATFISNPGFDEAPIHYTVAGDTLINEAAVRYIYTGVDTIGKNGWVFDVPGWSHGSIVIGNAVQIATGEYGTVANPRGFNLVPVPATDKDGNTTGAAVSMSAGWGDDAILYQEATLPSGRYVLKYDIINQHTNVNVAVNFSGFVPNEGTPTYGTRKSYPSAVWVTDSISFFLAEQTTGKINIGFTTSNSGSGNGAKFFIDNVKLISYGIDKSIMKTLLDSAIYLNTNRQEVGESEAYLGLEMVIDLAQAVYDDANATAADVLLMEEYLNDGIKGVHNAILLYSRVAAWTEWPVNVTSVIQNPSFESGFTGWTNDNVGATGLRIQSNASFNPFKAGTNYAERWVSSTSSLENLYISQVVENIPNGVYQLTVSAHATRDGDPVQTPGNAFIFANGIETEVFERADYIVVATVAENVLEFGFKTGVTGNWVAIDNFRLVYLSDGSGFFVTSADELKYSPSDTEKVLNITGSSLTGDVTLTTTSSFTLSKSTFTAAEVMAEGGVDVTVTSVANATVLNDSLVITQGDVRRVVKLVVNETLSVSNAAIFLDQSMTPIVTITVTGNVFGAVNLSGLAGISMSETSVSVANALAGRDVVLIWDGTTLLEDKYIYLTSGSRKDSVLVFASPTNLISSWDGDDLEGEGTRLTELGWTLTMADGATPVEGAFNTYNATSGIRLVPLTTQNYTYMGKPWLGHRVAYLRTWGDPATNVYNLNVNLEAGKSYKFRAVSTWHDNGATPTFTYAINTAPANTGDTLGIQANNFTVKRAGKDYSFTVQPTTTATHYLTVSSSVVGDVMATPFFLSIYEDKGTSTDQVNENSVRVYPTFTNGPVTIETAGQVGTVRVFNLSGRMVASQPLNGNLETVQLPAQGVYFLQIQVDNSIQTVKVIRTR